MEAAGSGEPVAVSVLPDVTGVDRLFTYSLSSDLQPEVVPGTIVRVPLAGRHVRGWVVARDVERPPGVALRAVERVVSVGLSPELVELAQFAAWRYVGRLRPFFLAGSPERIVTAPAARPPGRSLVDPRAVAPTPDRPLGDAAGLAQRAISLFAAGGGLLRLAPTASRQAVVEAAIAWCAARGGSDLLVLVPERRDVETLRRRLELAGHLVAVLPEAFAEAAGGGRVVIGTRSAVFGPVGRLGALLVLDANSESYVDQRAPTWNAVVLASERAARAEVPCVVTTAVPTPELLVDRAVAAVDGLHERGGWPAVDVIDRRGDDPRAGLYAPRLAEIIRGALDADERRPVVAVLNRRGRIRLLACGACGELARCEACGGALRQLRRATPGEPTVLTCPGCGEERPVVCGACGSTRMRSLRVGADRAAEELAALTGVATELVSGERDARVESDARLLVGTEAVLHRVGTASLVVFLDFDQHLLAARLRSAEQALWLLVLAGRLVGGRGRHGTGTFSRRLVVQTRLPDHDVLVAAVSGDPIPFVDAEDARRRARRLPPYGALAVISGEGAPDFLATFEGSADLDIGELEPGPARKDRRPRTAGTPAPAAGAPGSSPSPWEQSSERRQAGASLRDPESGERRFLVRAPDVALLCDLLAPARDLGPTVRVEVDPTDV